MMSANCLCGSSLPYVSCCEIVHQDARAALSAEALMRSRYTAFALQLIDFLYDTFHPSTRRFQDKKAIAQWSRENHWQGLEIIRATENTVEFKAHYIDQQGNPAVHHEKSRFQKTQGTWYYVDGKELQ